MRKDGSLCDSDDWSDCGRFCTRGGADIASRMARLREYVVDRADLVVAVSDFVRERMIAFVSGPDLLGPNAAGESFGLAARSGCSSRVTRG